ncbi:ABC transporter substrate-binding protein [Nonomuraea sp. NN258]|uniref:ABC transporter substrate-binding protein n=1 Tax=Nonomuraea antri TaxID=2730852 RepID=UPI0015695878|nr:ABC transporter substrate-binding protein [Nonomuraea antri]NRQ38202.1 ABC transporter substrate-binding protein [Nonomuraea antri]
MSSRRAIRLHGAGALALALALTATGCGSGSDDTSASSVPTRVIKADNGDIKVPVTPKRVVATGYAVPALIEAGAPLVGISSWKRGVPMMDAQTKATYEGLTKIAGETAAETNYEAIAKARPDIIVIGVPAPVLGDIDVKRLESIAPVVAIGPTVPSAWRELSGRQADAAGVLKGFETAKSQYEAKAAELKTKYQAVLPNLKLAHVGSYGEVAKGNFHREFDGSWGTNVANDLGAKYYGQVKVKGPGSKSVSEYPSIEELPSALGEADAITYSVDPTGAPLAPVQYVLDSKLWKNLPAVKAGKAYAFRYTEAATYKQAMQTLDSIDQALAPLLEQ